MINRIEQEVTTVEVNNIYRELNEEFERLLSLGGLPQALTAEIDGERDRAYDLYQRALQRAQGADVANESIERINELVQRLRDAAGDLAEV